MTPNTRHGFSAMCAGRGAEVERVLHHHESFAVAPWRNASAALSWPTINEYAADIWKVALCPVA